MVKVLLTSSTGTIILRALSIFPLGIPVHKEEARKWPERRTTVLENGGSTSLVVDRPLDMTGHDAAVYVILGQGPSM